MKMDRLTTIYMEKQTANTRTDNLAEHSSENYSPRVISGPLPDLCKDFFRK